MSDPANVFQAISAVASEVGAVRKDGRNQQQGFNFRGIDAVVNALSPAMRKHGLVVFPVVESVIRGTSQTAKGSTMNTVEVIAGYVFTGPDGSTFTAKVPGEAFDSGDKATAKAMSVAFRTVLLQTFALPTDEADPDESSYEAHRDRIPRPQQNPDTYQGPRPGTPAGQHGHPTWDQPPAQPPLVDWAKELLSARNSAPALRQLLAKAQGMGAPQHIIDQINHEGRALSERNVA